MADSFGSFKLSLLGAALLRENLPSALPALLKQKAPAQGFEDNALSPSASTT